MKNIKKDIPSLIGLISSASLALITTAITTPTTLSVLGSIGTSISANFLYRFTPEKIKNWFIDIHPNDLNHYIKKLFIKSINEALSHIGILFSETNYSEKEKKESKSLIKLMQKHLPEILSTNNEIQINEDYVKQFLYEKDEDIVRFIEDQFNSFGLTEAFRSFLAKNLPTQIQLCFGEGLKDPANQNAWIAFQRMLIEEIRSEIKQIADTQQSIKDDLSDLRFEKSGFSKKQISEIHQLAKTLNDKKIIEIKIKNGITQNIESIRDNANEVIRITTKTQLTVDELKIIIEKIRRQNRTNHIIIYTLAAWLVIIVVFGAYKIINQSFDVTVQVVDWKGNTNEWINEQIYRSNSKIKILDKEYTSIVNGEITINNNPAVYKNTRVKVRFKSEDNNLYSDTIITLYNEKTKPSELRIYVKGFESIHGYVKIENTDKGIDSALVFINNNNSLRVYTNRMGYFNMKIPREYQDITQTIIIQKETYKPEEKNITTNALLDRKDIPDIYLRPQK